MNSFVSEVLYYIDQVRNSTLERDAKVSEEILLALICYQCRVGNAHVIALILLVIFALSYALDA